MDNIYLVPTLQRGNACIDAPASSSKRLNSSDLTLERQHMHSHAGAWEREKMKQALNDSMFMADLHEVMSDFAIVDSEWWEINHNG